jgi:hypothetical protein
MKRTIIITAAAALALSIAFAYGPRFQNPTGAPTAAANGMGGMQAGAIFAGTLHDEAAALLGITPDELIAMHQSGKTLGDIAVELGQDAGTFKAALIDARNQAIDEAVANGELTEAQATFMKTSTEAAVTAQLQREVGPAAAFAYGPARGAQAYGRQTGRAVGPAGAPNGYGPNNGYAPNNRYAPNNGFAPNANGAPGWQQSGAAGWPGCPQQNQQYGRMGRR